MIGRLSSFLLYVLYIGGCIVAVSFTLIASTDNIFLIKASPFVGLVIGIMLARYDIKHWNPKD